MAWWNRVGTALGGLVDSVEAVPELAIDIAKAPFTSDGFGGFLANTWGATRYRVLQQGIGGLAKPLTEGVNLIPPSARDAIKSGADTVYTNTGLKALVGENATEDTGANGQPNRDKGLTAHEFFGHGVLGFLNASYRELVGEPISTAVTAGSLADSDSWEGRGNFGALFQAKTWKRASEIAQSRSPGQAVAVAFGTKDVLDPDEITKVQNSQWYPIVSGAVDAAARWYLDSPVLLSKGFQSAKLAGFLGEGIRANTVLKLAQEDLVQALDNRTKLQKIFSGTKAAEESAAGRAGDIMGGAQATEAELQASKAVADAKAASDASKAAAGVPAAVPSLGDPTASWAANDPTLTNIEKASNDAMSAINDIYEEARRRVEAKGLKAPDAPTRGADAINRHVEELYANGKLNVDDYDEVKSFLGDINNKYLEGLGLKVSSEANPQYAGLYSFQTHMVDLYTEAVHNGGASRTLIHEFFHSLSTFVPAEELRGFMDDFSKARESFIAQHPWLEDLGLAKRLQFTTGTEMRTADHWFSEGAKWSGEEINNLIAEGRTTAEEVGKVMMAVPALSPSGQAIYNYTLKPTSEIYRLANPDEFFAESLAEAYRGHWLMKEGLTADAAYHGGPSYAHLLEGASDAAAPVISGGSSFLDKAKELFATLMQHVKNTLSRGSDLAHDTSLVGETDAVAQPGMTNTQRLMQGFFGEGKYDVQGWQQTSVTQKASMVAPTANYIRPPEEVWAELVQQGREMIGGDPWTVARPSGIGPGTEFPYGRGDENEMVKSLLQLAHAGHIKPGEFQVVESFINSIGSDYFKRTKLGMYLSSDKTPLGSYNFENNMVKIYADAVQSGKFTRTMFHEMSHALTAFLPRDLLAAADNELKAARAEFFGRYPELQSALEHNENWIGARFSNRFALEFKDALEERGRADEFLKVLSFDKASGKYRLAANTDLYRLTNIDEYLAETMARTAAGRELRDNPTLFGKRTSNLQGIENGSASEELTSIGKELLALFAVHLKQMDAVDTTAGGGLGVANDVLKYLGDIYKDYEKGDVVLSRTRTTTGWAPPSWWHVKGQSLGDVAMPSMADELDQALPSAKLLTDGEHQLGMKDKIDGLFQTIRHGGIDGAFEHANRNVDKMSARLQMARADWERSVKPGVLDKLMDITNSQVPYYFRARAAEAADAQRMLPEQAAAAVRAKDLEEFGFGPQFSLTDHGIDEIKSTFPNARKSFAHSIADLTDEELIRKAADISGQVEANQRKLEELYAKKKSMTRDKKIATTQRTIDRLTDEGRTADWIRAQKPIVDSPYFSMVPGDSDAVRAAAREAEAVKAKARVEEAIGALPSRDATHQATLAFRTERIRDVFFHGAADGELPASWLALAQDRNEMDATLSFIMGNFGSLKDVAQTNPALAHVLEDVSRRRLMTRSFDLSDLHSSVSSMEAAFSNPHAWVSNSYGEELGDAVAKLVDLEHGGQDIVKAEVARMSTLMNGEIHATRMGALRQNVKYSAFWRSDKNPLHVFFDMTAQPVLNFDDPAFVGKFKRHLRDAGMSVEQQEYWLGRVGGLAGDARHGAIHEAVNDAISTLAEKHGFGDNMDLVHEIQRQISAGRITAKDMLLASDKKYGGYSTALGENWSHVRMETPGETAYSLFLPLSPEQLQQAAVMPNFYKLDKALSKVGQFVSRHPTVQWSDSMIQGVLDGVNHIWKPLALLRPAWPMRVVLDEQLRMASVLGMMKSISMAPKSFDAMTMDFMRKFFPLRDETGNALFLATDGEGNIIKRAAESGWQRSSEAIVSKTKAGAGVGAGSALLGGLLAGGPGAALGGVGGALMGVKMADRANMLNELRLTNLVDDLVFDRYHIAQAYGHAGDKAELYMDEASANRTRKALLDRSHIEAFGQRKFDPTRARMYMPDEANYEYFWNEVVNKQFGNSTFSRKLWDDTQTNDDIVDWLLARGEHAGNAAGPQTLLNMPQAWQDDPQAWVERARGYLHGNVMPASIDELAPFRQRMAEGGHVNFQEVKKTLEDAGYDTNKVLASIHGQDVYELHQSSNFAMRALNRAVSQTFTALGQIPTDNLSRNPFFHEIYLGTVKNELARRIALGEGAAEVSSIEMRAIEDQARRVALHEVRNVMYDLAENSRFSEMMSHLIPFFPAQQEVITRWAGLAVKNPVFFARMQQVYNAPSRAGWTGTDANGNEYVRVQIPEFARGLVGHGIFKTAMDNEGYISFDPKKLNMFDTSIGAGPIVNIAVAEAAKRKPELENTIGFLYPYGLPTGVMDALAPAWFRRVYASSAEDRSFGSVERGVAISKLTKMQVDGRPLDFNDPEAVQEFYDQVHQESKALFALRTGAALFSPVALQFKSPYQDMIDEFRKLKKEDPANAEDRFLAEHGDAFFALTQSFTRTLDGVPATFQGEAARDKYKALIESYPEYGGLIIGEEGAGAAAKFSSVIYKKQQEESISAGDPRKRRELIPLQDVVSSPDTRLGWVKFSNFQDWLTNQMAARRITSLQQKGAEDLLVAKQQFVQNLASAHPKWYEDYLNQDDAKWLKRMNAFRAIVSSDANGLASRPDIAGLAAYLDGRKRIERLLAAQKAVGQPSSITSAANRNISVQWEAFQNRLVESNPAFGALWSRWLQNDPVAANTWSK